MSDDLPEVAALERAAAWRLRLVDADPADARSAAAAAQLQKLADELRGLAGSPLHAEYQCMCNWLSQSDGISELALLTEDFCQRLGFGTWAADGEACLRALIGMAQEVLGTG